MTSYEKISRFARNDIHKKVLVKRSSIKSIGLNRAQNAMSVQKVPIEKRKQISIWGGNNKAKATIACLQCGRKTLAIMTIVTQDAPYGQNLFNAFKKNMSDACSISGRATGSRKDAASGIFYVSLYGPNDDQSGD